MFKVGDIVCFKASFLRSIQWHTDVPEKGTVTEVFNNMHVKVDWNDDFGSTGSHSSNLILYEKRHLEPV